MTELRTEGGGRLLTPRLDKVVDKKQLARVQAELNEALSREKEAKARVAEKVAAQAEGHAVSVRELEDELAEVTATARAGARASRATRSRASTCCAARSTR